MDLVSGNGGVGAGVRGDVEEVPRLGLGFCMREEEMIDLTAELVGEPQERKGRTIDGLVQG